MPSFEIGLSVRSILKFEPQRHQGHKTYYRDRPSRPLCLGGEMLDLDFNVRAIDANVIPIHSSARRWAKHFAGGNVKNASVPGAGHLHTTQFTFAERPAHMCASVVDRMKRSADVEKRDLLTVDLDHSGGAGRNVFGLRNFYKLWHWFLSLLEECSI